MKCILKDTSGKKMFFFLRFVNLRVGKMYTKTETSVFAENK